MKTKAIVKYDRFYIESQVICGRCGFPAPKDVKNLTFKILKKEGSTLLPFPIPYNCKQCDKYELLAKINRVDFQLDATLLVEQRKYEYSTGQKFVELLSPTRVLK